MVKTAGEVKTGISCNPGRMKDTLSHFMKQSLFKANNKNCGVRGKGDFRQGKGWAPWLIQVVDPRRGLEGEFPVFLFIRIIRVRFRIMQLKEIPESHGCILPAVLFVMPYQFGNTQKLVQFRCRENKK